MEYRSIILLHHLLLLLCPMIRLTIGMVSISIDLWMERYLDIYRMHLYSNLQIEYTFYHSERILLVVHLRIKKEHTVLSLKIILIHTDTHTRTDQAIEIGTQKRNHATETDSIQELWRETESAIEQIRTKRKHKFTQISHICTQIKPQWKWHRHFNRNDLLPQPNLTCIWVHMKTSNKTNNRYSYMENEVSCTLHVVTLSCHMHNYM